MHGFHLLANQDGFGHHDVTRPDYKGLQKNLCLCQHITVLSLSSEATGFAGGIKAGCHCTQRMVTTREAAQ